MDTNRIKCFATEARNKLKEGIAAKIRTLGFDKQGKGADTRSLPRKRYPMPFTAY